jgi:hypothetical protein
MYTPKLATFIPILALICAGGARAQVPKGCVSIGSDLKELLETEYAFAQKAQESVRDAFLAYLAEDSLVLQPKPTPGRPFYEAATPSGDKLQWYPAIAAVAPGGDLGFSTGPWIYTTADGTHSYGDFITVWKRDPSCHWRAQFDGGISHAMPQQTAPKLLPAAVATATAADTALPPKKLTARIDEARRDFERTAQQDGLAAGLRTYARDGDFRFYVEGQAPQGAGPANQYLAGSAVASWTEDARGRSADATLAYSVGRFTNAKKGGQHAYLQIWQYDPKVANWGLRIFLMAPMQGDMTRF